MAAWEDERGQEKLLQLIIPCILQQASDLGYAAEIPRFLLKKAPLPNLLQLFPADVLSFSKKGMGTAAPAFKKITAYGDQEIRIVQLHLGELR